MPKVTINTLREKRAKKEPMTYLTAYDYPTAILEQKAGIDVILVGDSIGMVIYGYDSTLPVTVDLMMPHVKAVRLGAPDVYLVGDMPYMSYQVSKSEAIRNGGRFMAEGGCDAVKLEGGREMAETIRAMVDASIPVMGHMGLTPQAAAQLGGYRVQGKDVATAKEADRGRGHSPGSWCLDTVAGSGSRRGDAHNHEEGIGPGIRHRRWTSLRWASSGHPRHDRHVRPQACEVCEEVRRGRRANSGSTGRVQEGSGRGGLSRAGALLSNAGRCGRGTGKTLSGTGLKT